jgi:hypothetical protein
VPDPGGKGFDYTEHYQGNPNGVLIVDLWNEVRFATISNGVIIPGAAVPPP